LGREYDLIIGGKAAEDLQDKIRSTNPARPAQVVGVHQKAGAEHADRAMAAAHMRFEHGAERCG
jgi:1-pyrroline-5-carboxylate dehydrogenase